ncbi:hypothetical protein [Desulfosarcina variabilis]|uniref:hypothetical protein n=1 Tax=Desulfosarcina variabilis TaxID=2300 RepID=UPI003AFB61AF
MKKSKKKSATGCATDAKGLLNMTEYGRRIGVSRQRVGKYIEKGYISESAYTRQGKKVLINPEIADADLDASLSGSQLIKANLTTTAPGDSDPNSSEQRVNTITDGVDRKEADRRKALAQARHWEVKTKILEDLYIDREWAEMQLAARAMVLKSDMENFFRSRAPEIIAKCDGKQEFAPDVIEYLLTNLESWLGRYSEPIEFEVKQR